MPRGPVVLVGHSMGGMTIMALAAARPELFGDRIVGVALMSTSSGNLADLDFGLPELLTRVRAAVFPVAAWTMRRRPRAGRAHPPAGRRPGLGRHPVALVRLATSTRRWPATWTR